MVSFLIAILTTPPAPANEPAPSCPVSFAKLEKPRAPAEDEIKALLEPQALKEYFSGGAYREDPAKTWAVLFSLRQKDPAALTKVLKEHDDLLSVLSENRLHLKDLPPELASKWQKAARKLLEEDKTLITRNAQPDTLKRLFLYRPYLAQLSFDERDELFDSIIDPMVENARKVYPDISPSKLDHFMEQILNPTFLVKKTELNDYMFIREKDEVIPVILSTSAIDGDESTRTAFGFYLKKLPPIKTDSAGGKPGEIIAERTVKWQSAGAGYEAKFRLRQGVPVEKIAPNAKSADYASIWKDDKFQGVIYTGANIDDFAPTIRKGYMSYYRAQGYKFDDGVEVKDFRNWLRRSIESGRLDYEIKEAHAGGIDQDHITLMNTGKIFTGTHTLRDGRVETIAIFAPDKADIKGRVTITNEEYGRWFKQRARDPKNGELVYFNTGCWGAHGVASNEVADVGRKNFVEIASTEEADTFTNDPKTAYYQLIDGFRKGKSWKDIREAMRVDKTYRDNEFNTYIEPGDRRYRKMILNPMPNSTTADVRVYRDNKPYDITDELLKGSFNKQDADAHQ